MPWPSIALLALAEAVGRTERGLSVGFSSDRRSQSRLRTAQKRFLQTPFNASHVPCLNESSFLLGA